MKFRLIPALLILLVIVVTVRLGFWQRDRAHQKEALEAHISQFENAPAQTLNSAPLALKDIEFHRVKARGSFVADKVVYLDNRPYNDQPGFYVVMPFKLADGGGYVLVNRGWLPRNMNNRETIAPYSTPQGEIEIEGIARADATRAFELGQGGSAEHQLIRQNLDTAAYAAETGLPLQPFVIQQLSDDGDKLVRDWPAPDNGVERNYGYMFQWWGMAAAALVFGLYAARRAGKKAPVSGV
ncbi:SURF1 family protein [Paraburkholderia sp. BL21I4N1]|uniref:SURF1 family protein n=1 Tax=Paraburkholderia sp. BL21I4N1 TaxID=1938801 RepID=UPI000CFDA9DD|nr:SURF1 family protein [Paraburkholderia sp. BL21I4N1]PQV45861.1 cytochrome oxidase assembly protein ShyY1 [Paraburkholderia sp. BL21I4N1]